jgi:Lysophospholipase
VDRVRERAPEIRMPVLIVHGGADAINSAEGSKELFAAVSSEDKTLHVYPGGHHEPHNDLEKEEAVTDITEWISARTPILPAYLDR